MQKILNRKLQLWLLAAPLALAMTGCWHDDNNNGGGGGGNVNPDVAGPSVTATTPVDGTLDVAMSGNITATFSEEMNPATITATTFTVMEGTTEVPGANIPGEVTYAGTVATFNPTSDLNANTVFTAMVTTDAKDAAGNALTAKKTWSFTTGSAPMVSFMVPDDLTTDVALNRNITATFSEAMNAETVTGATTFTLTTMDGDMPVQVPGTVTYAGNVATFNPTADLAPSKKYTALVTTDAKDMAGDALPWNISWEFTTGTAADSTAPTVSSTVPAADATDVATNASLTATFSEPMDATTITSAFTVLEGTMEAPGANVPGEVTFIGTVATFNPTSVLSVNTVLTAKITTAAKDLAGNALAAEKVWSFTTGALPDTTPPTISFTTPFSHHELPINENVSITFDEAMDIATITSSTFRVTNEKGEWLPGKVTYADNVATFNPTQDLPAGASFTATITAGAKDLAGNALVENENTTWPFTTPAVAGPVPTP